MQDPHDHSQDGGGGSRRETERRFDMERMAARLDRVDTGLSSLADDVTALHRDAQLGVLARMIAHEFRNLLTPVVASAKAAMADPGELDLAQHALRLAAEAGEQAGSIAESILDLADRSDAPTSCSVRAAADRAVRLASGKTQRGRHSIALRLPHDLIAPIAERDLAQVLLNLILNACNAMPGGGRVTITTPGEGECSTWNTDDASPAVRVLVRDQGLGMDQGRLDKARRALGEGSAGTPGRAVGLSVCGEIVGRVGGRVDIEAEPGMGTTAILVFPSKPNEARKAA